LFDDLVGQRVPLLDELLLALHLVDALHRRADLDELVLRLLPLPLIDQLLHLLQLRRGERDLVVAGRFLLTEDRGPHAVQRVPWAGPVHGSAEPADAQHRCCHGSDDRERAAGTPIAGQPAVQGLDRIVVTDRRGDGRIAHLVTQPGEEEGEFGFCGVGREDRLLGRERFEEAVGSVDLIERRISATCRPPTEIRHLAAPFRSAHP